MIVETAFPGLEERLAVLAKHLCRRMLAEQLAQLNWSAEIFVTHLKAGEGEKITQEVRPRAGQW